MASRRAEAAAGATDAGDSLDQLDRLGWAVIDSLLTPSETDALAAACDGRQWPDISADLLGWITDPRWTAPAVAVLGADIRFFRERVITKASRSGSVVPWHQDNGYAGLTAEFLSYIVALEDMTVANGCLWMLSGTHRHGVMDHVPGAGYRLEIESPIAELGVAAELGKGSALVFSSLTYHRSGANDTDTNRRAWMVQFCRSDTVDQAGVPVVGCPVVAEHGTWLARPHF